MGIDSNPDIKLLVCHLHASLSAKCNPQYIEYDVLKTDLGSEEQAHGRDSLKALSLPHLKRSTIQICEIELYE